MDVYIAEYLWIDGGGVDSTGYIEDRCPAATVDPYVATRLIFETVLGK